MCNIIMIVLVWHCAKEMSVVCWQLQLEEETWRTQLASVEAERNQLAQQTAKEKDISKKLDAEEERWGRWLGLGGNEGGDRV